MKFSGVLSTIVVMSTAALCDPTLYATTDCSGGDDKKLSGNYVAKIAGGCYSLEAHDMYCHHSVGCFNPGYSFQPDQDGDWTIYRALTCGTDKYQLTGLTAGNCYQLDNAAGVKHH